MSTTDKRPLSPPVADETGENSDPIPPAKALRFTESSDEFDWYDKCFHD